MSKQLQIAFDRHRISFMGGMSATRFGFGVKRLSIAIEPYVQFRGGRFDVEHIGAFTYLGCPLSQYRYVKSIGRFCSLAPKLTVGAFEHSPSMLSAHSMFTGHWAPLGRNCSPNSAYPNSK